MNKIIAVVGPTASGKSDLAVDIAKFISKNKKRFGVNGAEIISADSRQIYKLLDIGSNKVTRREMSGIKHHLSSIASPKRTFTVVRYQKLAAKVIGQILEHGNVPILCGGTGLYVDSVIYGMRFPEVKPDAKLRKKLDGMATEKLFKILSNKDPKKASVIDIHNRRRLIRALEIVLTTKKPVPLLKKERAYDVLTLGITKDREKLKRRIIRRLIERLKKGLVREVKNLHEKTGLSWKRLGDFGLEYRFVSQLLQEKITKKETEEKIITESIRYAKRQMTWFKRDRNIKWIADKQKALRLVKDFLV